MNANFERIIIIGYGSIVIKVITHVNMLKEKYGYSLEYIEHEVHEFNTAINYCRDNFIPITRIEEKSDLTNYLDNVNRQTLLISASNNYIIPSHILNKDNITAINFHNALLPEYPGRNAPSWAIYDGLKETGITWHYVTSCVDNGSIIIQKKLQIGDNVKAYELAGSLMDLAYEAFSECFEDVLTGLVTPIEQPPFKERRIYKSSEVPGNAMFDVNDSPAYIYRLLRSVDYAKFDIFPYVTTFVNGQKVRILRYRLVSENTSAGDGNSLIYKLNDQNNLLIKYRPF